jgi:nucleoside-diphosphate-sugar epimerase
MKVLITGANGFIGRHLVEGLCEEHSVTTLTRKDVQLTDRKSVDKYFSKNIFDVVVHYALDDSKLRKLGWKTKKVFDDELPSIVNYYKEKFIW